MANWRPYVIGGESRPNKNRGLLGCFLFTWANWSLIKSKTQYLKFSLRNRVYHLHKLVLFTENEKQTNKQTKQNKTHKTKQGSTLNILTEIGSESARYITRLLGQTANFGSSFRLVKKFINESKWNTQTKRFLTNKITAT